MPEDNRAVLDLEECRGMDGTYLDGAYYYDCGLWITTRLIEDMVDGAKELLHTAHQKHHDENHEPHGVNIMGRASWSFDETIHDIDTPTEYISIRCPDASH